MQKRSAKTSGRTGASPPLPAEEMRTLLIVDDEEGPRQSLRMVFEDRYHVLLAESGQEALDLARRRPIDAAVVDIRMSGMSGIELLGRLKAIDSGVEVTILTAYAALETARQAVRLGATDYLTKPFDVDTIRETVARMMDRRALHQRTATNLDRLQDLENEVQRLRDHGELLHNRGQIYGDVLHDINKPLTVIVGMLSLLNHRLSSVERLEGEEMAQLRQRLKTLNRQADNVIEVIQRYLSFLRQEAKGTPTTNVNQVLSDLRDLLRVYPGAQDREINFQLLPTEVLAKVNSTDMLQMLLNLTVNAVQATPETQPVEVAGRVAEGPLDLAHWQDGPTRRCVRAPEFDNAGPMVLLSVRDRGEGIPPELVDKLFDQPVTTKPQGRGTGLGLTIVKRLLLVSRGALLLETAPQRGTTITVVMPALQHAPVATPTEPQTTHTRPG